ncbi:adhesion G protein-coupled receptor L3-like [Macrobrachium nipponense]|uniref:adhesion G protein-coupled receptor L3-like n=1 Tax=Macrobrachium nipponense TaxID=159736 RepID=UPI0030C80713
MARNTLFCLIFLIVPFSDAAEGFQKRSFYEHVNSALSSDDLEELDSLLNVSRLSEQKGNPVVSQFVFQALDRKALKCLGRLMELCPDGKATKAFLKTAISSSCEQQAGINLCNFWEAASETSNASPFESYMIKGCGRCLAQDLGHRNETTSKDPFSVDDEPNLSQCQNYSNFWADRKESDDVDSSSGSHIWKKLSHEVIYTIYGMIMSWKGNILENKGPRYVRDALENWKSILDGHLSRLCKNSTTVESVSKEVLLAVLYKELEISDPQQSFVHCILEKMQNRTINESCSICSDIEYENTVPEGKGTILSQKKMVQMCGRCLKKTVVSYGHRFVLKSTRQGDTLRLACPINHESTFVSWTCRQDSTWDAHPDLSLCRGNVSLFPAPVGNTSFGALKNLTALIANIHNVELYPADAVMVLEGTEELQRKFQEEDFDMNFNSTERESFFRAVADVAANVLRDPVSFAVDNATRGRMLSSTQDLVTNFFLKFEERMQTNLSFTYKNEEVGVLVKKMPVAHFKEERNRLITHNYSHTTSVLLPEDFYDGYETADNGSQHVLVQGISYRDLHKRHNGYLDLSNVTELTGNVDKKGYVNCHIIDVTIGSGSWKATTDQLIQLNFSHIYHGKGLNLSNVKCVWWNSSANVWSTEGCSLNFTTGDYSVCHCDHLTGLAVTMDIYGIISPSLQAQEELVLHLVSEIGSGASILCLVLTITSYWIVMSVKKNQRLNRSTKSDLTMINLCLCLCLFLCLFLPRVTAETSEELCIAITFFRHYFIMATFTWNALWSLFLFINIIQVLSNITPTTKQILIAGYFLPLFIVVFSLVLSFSLQIYNRKDVCWLAPGFALWSFICTLSLILLVNLIIYGMVVQKMCTRSDPATNKDHSKTVIKLKGSVATFLSLGLTWSVGWLLMLQESPPFYLKLTFNLATSLQGVGIFLFNVLLHDKNMEMLRGFIGNLIQTIRYRHGTSFETQEFGLDEMKSDYKKYKESQSTEELSVSTPMMIRTKGYHRR